MALSATKALPVSHSPSVTAPTAFYIPSLDGVRAVAFAIVFIAHANGQVRGGMFGVTIFFFLSGYLITTLLRRENDLHGKISMSHFYARRVLRILPPFYLVLGFLLLLVHFHVIPQRVTGAEVSAFSFFMGNYWLIYGNAHNQALGPMWSLAVEEHFYLFFPLLFVLLNKARVAYRMQAVVLAGLALVVLFWRVALTLHHSTNATIHILYGTDCRIDGILFGCILALAWNPVMDKGIKPSWWLVALGVMGEIASVLIHNDTYHQTFHYTLQGICLIPIFMAVVTWGDTWFAWLNLRPVRYVGTLSYTLYLVHRGLIFSGVWHLKSHALAISLALVGSFVIAVLMNVLVERPLVQLRKRLA